MNELNGDLAPSVLSADTVSVLLIEDDESDAHLIRRYLGQSSSPSFDLTHSSHLQDGLKRIKNQSFDGLLLDLALPDSQGMETVRKVCSECPDIPLVVLTGRSDPDVGGKTIEMGAQDFLPKGDLTPTLLSRTLLYSIERFRTQQQLQGEFRSAVEKAANAIFITDREGTIRYVNPAFIQQTGYGPKEAVGQTPRILQSDHHEASFFEKMWMTILSGNVWEAEVKNRQKNGGTYWVHQMITPISDSQGEPTRFVAVNTDISDRKEKEDHLRDRALTDELTGLPNRTAFLDMLRTDLNDGGSSDSSTVLFLDLDDFKTINDSFGHGVGDLVLKRVGRRLKHSTRSQDQVARFGGDEFVVLVNEVSEEGQVELIVQRLVDSIEEPIKVSNRKFRLGLSVGVVSGIDVYQETADVLRDADAAMYRAKKSLRSYEVFQPLTEGGSFNNESFGDELRQALKEDQFTLRYQPLLDLRDRSVFGAEALIRWDHPKEGCLRPQEFLHEAKQIGLIHQIDRRVLRRACRQWSRWKSEGLVSENSVVTVNHSLPSLLQEDAAEKIVETLNELEDPSSPFDLYLEVTEEEFIETDKIESMLRTLRDGGIRIAVDYFGTGYSSLYRVNEWPVSTLKIDYPLVSELSSSAKKRRLCRGIVEFAHATNLTVVAEGVETEYQLSTLEDMGCDFAQGHFFSEPLDGISFEQWMSEQTLQTSML